MHTVEHSSDLFFERNMYKSQKYIYMYVQDNESNTKKGGLSTQQLAHNNWHSEFNIIAWLCWRLDPEIERPKCGEAAHYRVSSMPAEPLLSIPRGNWGGGGAESGMEHLSSSHTQPSLSLQQGPGSRQLTNPWSATMCSCQLLSETLSYLLLADFRNAFMVELVACFKQVGNELESSSRAQQNQANV